MDRERTRVNTGKVIAEWGEEETKAPQADEEST